MRQSTIAIYCFLDDLLKAIDHCEDNRARVGDAQISITGLITMLEYDGNDQKGFAKDSRSRSVFSNFESFALPVEVSRVLIYNFNSQNLPDNLELHELSGNYALLFCQIVRHDDLQNIIAQMHIRA